MNKISYFSLYFRYMMSMILFLSVSRLAMSLWMFERVNEVNGWKNVLLQGLRIDIATLCSLLVIPVLFTVFLTKKDNLFNRLTITCVRIWLIIITAFLVFIELCTPSFILEYNIRPNRLFIEYLIYPQEVFGMLIKSRLPEIINTTILTCFAGYVTWRWSSNYSVNHKIIPSKLRWLTAILVVLVASIGTRSTTGHRPLNPSMVYSSNDPLVNSLTLNSTYSVLWSLKQLVSEKSSTDYYGKISPQTIEYHVREFKGGSIESYISEKIPTYSEQYSSYKGKKKNLVIILEESLGARFIGSLGGLSLTPNLDTLAKEGIYFEKIFATGTRSVRGIEAIIAGFTPTHDRAAVKLDKSQQNFFTIAQLLQQENYHTEFIYGGAAHFDNMKSFFLGNGFSSITEQKDFDQPKFTSSWGVSDEDLFIKAHQRFDKLSNNKQPFFSLVFTSTNHEPFEFPAGRIPLYDSEIHTQNNAIQYADWALGQFIKKAKQSDYWKDTIFLIIADHDARSRGADLVPIKSFHIPALILGSDIEPRLETRIVSQIDMPPTLLSLVGVDNNSPMLGTDLTSISNDFSGRAILQNGDNFGYLTASNITILQPKKEALTFTVDWSDFSLDHPRASNKIEKERAKSIAMWGKYAYDHDLYRLPAVSNMTARTHIR